MNILVSAYACNPTSSLQLHPGEDITGWRQVGQIRRFHKVWVITHSYNRDGVEKARSAGEYPDVVFHFLDLGAFLGLLYKAEIGQRIYYYLWQIKAWRVARRLHRIGFDLAHHVTFGNDWIGSFIGAFLPVPYIHGPVGGGQRTPRPLLAEYTRYGRFAEGVRETAQWVGRSDYRPAPLPAKGQGHPGLQRRDAGQDPGRRPGQGLLLSRQRDVARRSGPVPAARPARRPGLPHPDRRPDAPAQGLRPGGQGLRPAGEETARLGVLDRRQGRRGGEQSWPRPATRVSPTRSASSPGCREPSC